MLNPAVRQMLNKVPEVTLAFWVIKIMSTTVGETGADYLAVRQRVIETTVLITIKLDVANVLALQHLQPKPDVVPQPKLVRQPPEARHLLARRMLVTRHHRLDAKATRRGNRVSQVAMQLRAVAVWDVVRIGRNLPRALFASLRSR